jgi:hypothetical protein
MACNCLNHVNQLQITYTTIPEKETREIMHLYCYTVYVHVILKGLNTNAFCMYSANLLLF